jgi:hypothetical protein
LALNDTADVPAESRPAKRSRAAFIAPTDKSRAQRYLPTPAEHDARPDRFVAAEEVNINGGTTPRRDQAT